MGNALFEIAAAVLMVLIVAVAWAVFVGEPDD